MCFNRCQLSHTEPSDNVLSQERLVTGINSMLPRFLPKLTRNWVLTCLLPLNSPHLTSNFLLSSSNFWVRGHILWPSLPPSVNSRTSPPDVQLRCWLPTEHCEIDGPVRFTSVSSLSCFAPTALSCSHSRWLDTHMVSETESKRLTMNSASLKQRQLHYTGFISSPLSLIATCV